VSRRAVLNLLADSIGTARILLLVNYRPEYRHECGNKTYYTQLRLDPLGKESADEMLTALLGEEPELAPLSGSSWKRPMATPSSWKRLCRYSSRRGGAGSQRPTSDSPSRCAS